MPDGLDTELRPGTATLDAPQAQQLALARVVLANPRTVIAIAHRPHTAHDARRVVVIDGGRVAEQGSHRELIAAGGVYATLWASWHGAEPPTS